MSALPVTIFSDFVCPASYVTERALERIGDGRLDLRYRAWELFPEPAEPQVPDFEPTAWEALAELGVEVGLRVVHPAAGANTRKAHEAAHFARSRGAESVLRAAIYDAYWTRGADIGRIDLLAELGGNVGLDAEELRIALDIDAFRDNVLADQALGTALGIPGTPVLYFGEGRDARVVAGARSHGELAELVRGLLSDRGDSTNDV